MSETVRCSIREMIRLHRKIGEQMLFLLKYDSSKKNSKYNHKY